MKQEVEKKASILLVDDDRLVLSTLSAGLKAAGYKTNTAESVDESEEWLANNKPDLVLLDMSMPDKNGLALAPTLTELDSIPFILLTAYNDREIVEEAKKAGAISYLVKPIGIEEIVPSIETALERAKEIKGLQKNGEMLQVALDGDRSVSVAVGILMERYSLNNSQAFESIRKHARSNHLKLIDVAKKIINASEELSLFL